MKKRIQLPKLKIPFKATGKILTPLSTKRSNTPQTMSPYSTTSLDGRQSFQTVKKKSKFGIIKTVQRKSTYSKQLIVKQQQQCESPRKFSTISTVTTIPVEEFQNEEQKKEKEEQFELKYPNNPLKHPQLDFLFNQTEEETEQYNQEGNAKFYTEEMKQTRQSLKQQPQIIECINKFIQDCFPLIESQTLSKQNYIQSFFRISCILRPQLYKNSKFSEMQKLLENDWIHDTKGKNQYTIEKEDLVDSIWELVDIWTPEVSQELYIAFLETLKMKFILPISNLGENSEKRISIYDIM